MSDLTLDEFLKYTVRQFMAGNYATIELVGSPGVGKTACVREAVHQIALALVARGDIADPSWLWFEEVVVSAFDPPDVQGFMVPDVDPERGTAESIFTRPAFFPPSSWKDGSPVKYGVLFIDEYSQSAQDIKKILARLNLDHRLGKYPLPLHTLIILASNRVEDKSGVTRDLAMAVNRKGSLNLRMDLDGWMRWGSGPGVIHNDLLAYVRDKQGTCFASSVPADLRPFCTPRSLAKANAVLCAEAGSRVNPSTGAPYNREWDIPAHSVVAQAAIAGWVGAAVAGEIMTFVKMAGDLPSPDEIIANPKTAKVPKSPGAMMMLAFRCVGIVTETNVDAIMTYLLRFGEEFQTAAIGHVIETDHDKANTMLGSPMAQTFFKKHHRLAMEAFHKAR